MEKEIIINYTPTIDTLTKVSKYILLNLPIVKFIPMIIVFLILSTKMTEMLGVENINKEPESPYQDYLTFLIIIIGWIIIYFRIMATMKKNLLTNKKNFETQKITLTRNSYIQQGETFRVENFWNEIYKIKETKEWFLIYLKKNIAFPIIKSDLLNNQYLELKELFNSLSIKKSLK